MKDPTEGEALFQAQQRRSQRMMRLVVAMVGVFLLVTLIYMVLSET